MQADGINNSGMRISLKHHKTLECVIVILELGCGTTLFTNSSGVISLPINPTGYPAPLDCTYTISAKDLTYIFLSSDISPSDQLLKSFQDCDREWLKVGCVHSFVNLKINFKKEIFSCCILF